MSRRASLGGKLTGLGDPIKFAVTVGGFDGDSGNPEEVIALGVEKELGTRHDERIPKPNPRQPAHSVYELLRKCHQNARIRKRLQQEVFGERKSKKGAPKPDLSLSRLIAEFDAFVCADGTFATKRRHDDSYCQLLDFDVSVDDVVDIYIRDLCEGNAPAAAETAVVPLRLTWNRRIVDSALDANDDYDGLTAKRHQLGLRVTHEEIEAGLREEAASWKPLSAILHSRLGVNAQDCFALATFITTEQGYTRSDFMDCTPDELEALLKRSAEVPDASVGDLRTRSRLTAGNVLKIVTRFKDAQRDFHRYCGAYRMYRDFETLQELEREVVGQRAGGEGKAVAAAAGDTDADADAEGGAAAAKPPEPPRKKSLWANMQKKVVRKPAVVSSDDGEEDCELDQLYRLLECGGLRLFISVDEGKNVKSPAGPSTGKRYAPTEFPFFDYQYSYSPPCASFYPPRFEAILNSFPRLRPRAPRRDNNVAAAKNLLQRLKVFAADKLHHLSHGGKPFDGPNEQRQLMLLDATGIKHVLVDGVQHASDEREERADYRLLLWNHSPGEGKELQLGRWVEELQHLFHALRSGDGLYKERYKAWAKNLMAAQPCTTPDAIPSPHIRFKTRSGVKVQLSVDLARKNGAPGQLLYKMRARRVDFASKVGRRAQVVLSLLVFLFALLWLFFPLALLEVGMTRGPAASFVHGGELLCDDGANRTVITVVQTARSVCVQEGCHNTWGVHLPTTTDGWYKLVRRDGDGAETKKYSAKNFRFMSSAVGADREICLAQQFLGAPSTWQLPAVLPAFDAIRGSGLGHAWRDNATLAAHVDGLARASLGQCNCNLNNSSFMRTASWVAIVHVLLASWAWVVMLLRLCAKKMARSSKPVLARMGSSLLWLLRACLGADLHSLEKTYISTLRGLYALGLICCVASLVAMEYALWEIEGVVGAKDSYRGASYWLNAVNLLCGFVVFHTLRPSDEVQAMTIGFVRVRDLNTVITSQYNVHTKTYEPEIEAADESQLNVENFQHLRYHYSEDLDKIREKEGVTRGAHRLSPEHSLTVGFRQASQSSHIKQALMLHLVSENTSVLGLLAKSLAAKKNRGTSSKLESLRNNLATSMVRGSGIGTPGGASRRMQL